MGFIIAPPLAHASSHQEIAGGDPEVNYGLFERIARVQKTANNANVAMFSGIASNTDNTLQSGHGWGGSGNANGSFNYTGDSIIGTQCIQLVSAGDGSVCRTTSPRMTAFNLTSPQQMIRIWLKFSSTGYSNFLNCFFYVGSGASQFLNSASVQLAGGSMDNRVEYGKTDEWVSYTLSPASFITIAGTIDWTALQDFRVAIQDKGGGTSVSVLFGGIDFVACDTTYPHGVVSFTFDDSYVGPFTLARGKLEQYGYKATFYAINDVLGTNPSTYMSQAQIDQLHALGHEIAPHAWFVNDHNISGGFTGISAQELIQANFGAQKGWIHQKGYKGVNNFAYPQGMYDSTLLSYVKQQFACARTTGFRSIETMPVGNVHRLRALPTDAANGLAVTPNGTAGTLEWYLDQIFTYGGWAIFYTHNVVASGASGNQTNQASFNTLVDYIATKGIPVRTVGDVLGI